MGFMRDMDDMSYSIKCGIWRSRIGVQTLRGTLLKDNCHFLVLLLVSLLVGQQHNSISVKWIKRRVDNPSQLLLRKLK